MMTPLGLLARGHQELLGGGANAGWQRAGLVCLLVEVHGGDLADGRHRAKQRTATGAGAPGATWEPDHFTTTHALARKAAALCAAREHTARRHLGGVACGQCWETAIRADERIVVATERTP